MDTIDHTLNNVNYDIIDDVFKPFLEIDAIEYHEGKYTCCGCNMHGRSWEAFWIFTETMYKKVARLLTSSFTNKFQYFAHNETYDDIYKFDYIHNKHVNGENAIYNIGHATELICINNINILTDPVFGDLNAILYPAHTKNGIEINELPKIDIIIISHNHRDHLDEFALKQLLKNNSDITIYVPLGDKDLLQSWGFQNVLEVKWGETCSYKDILITAVPSKHWSGRNIEKCTSATNGWIINNNESIIYFAGDTAMLNEKELDNISALIYSKCFKSSIQNITFLQPAGPNYSRADMQETHMSTPEVFKTNLHFFNFFAKCYTTITQNHLSNEQLFDWWLKHTNTIMIHQNKYELGPDIFNCGYWIAQKMETLLNSLKLYDKNNAKLALCRYALNNKDDAFIYNDLITLINNNCFQSVRMFEVNEFLQKLISSVKWPKVGEKFKI